MANRALTALIADAYLRLDPRLHVLAWEVRSPALRPLAQALQWGLARPLSEFLSIHDASPSALRDRAVVAVAGCGAEWIARVEPLFDSGTAPIGFDLYLLPVSIRTLPGESAAAEPPRSSAQQGSSDIESMLGDRLAAPVSRIVTAAEIIQAQRSGPLADRYAAYAGDIAAAARHLLALIGSLCEPEANSSPTTQPIDLAVVARHAIGVLEQRAEERRMTFAAPADGASWPAVGEPRRVLQILLNLLDNALRYAPAGSTVRLDCDHRAGRALLTVGDDGPGLDEAAQTRIFDKFERLGRAGDGGSGLGLYISRRLARDVGGDLTVATAPGEGTRFTLDLPGE